MMDEITKRLVERTRERQEVINKQKRQLAGIESIQRKRRPLAPQNEDEIPRTPEDNDPSESPSKRSKVDTAENFENEQQPASETEFSASSKSKQSGHVNLRMQKLLTQRKIWEAEEKGENISFDEASLPSPVRHDTPPVGTVTESGVIRKTSSSEQDGRKRRLAALAERVKGWEDDITHHEIPKMAEQRTAQISSKPPTGKTLVVSAVPVQKPSVERAASPEAKAVRQEKELSVEGLVKFAVAGKAAERKSPAKPARQLKSSNALSNNAKEVGNDEGPIQGSKTLQQRMIDLQSNGITEADFSAVNTSSASSIMERARAEREKELEELRNRKVSGKTAVETGKNAQEPARSKLDSEASSQLSCDQDRISSQSDDEVGTSTWNDTEMEGDDEEEDGQELSYTDSMFDDESRVSGATLFYGRSYEEDSASQADEFHSTVEGVEAKLSGVSVSEVSASEPDMTKDKIEDTESRDIKMVDELFEGALSGNEGFFPSPRTESPLTVASLTRQKSRLEVRCELTARNQTCNEAEDTHALTQPSKFQRTCLSRSNSTESIVSLCQENDFPMYTISAYRTDRRRQSAKFEKRVVRNETEAAKATLQKKHTEESVSTQDMIADMMEQVSRQQRVIQQASAALNCCYDAQHGKGTVTEVEAEKLLLISSEKRLALLGEVKSLKESRAAKPEPQYKPCTGAIIINNVRLPLRTEYIFSLANKREAGDLRNHYYFVLARHRHQMFATQLVSTLDDLSGDSLVFKDQFKIDDLKSDFKITLEVYSLNHRTRADGVPMQDKSKGKLSGILHKKKAEDAKRAISEAIGKTKSKVKKSAMKNSTGCNIFAQQDANDSFQSLTPKKLRAAKRMSHMPSLMSPGGPNAIRISNFCLIGSATIALKDIAGSKFALQKVPFLSPISGQIFCRLSASFHSGVEQRGFLTMFDDVGGLGAWHRRWCALRQGRLYSWTYPDDEQHKKPLMAISMAECISRDCSTVERILCARPNTFELRTMRPRRHGDKQNLISEDTGSVITTRHWLSADTKEERLAWIASLNQALADVRAWDTEALKPFK